MVSTNGIITRVAGNGTYGFAGDGGAATSASLSYPEGVALDAFGNLYIADGQDNRIRMVSTSGVITTVAGNINATNFYGGYSGDGGAATNASLNYPNGVAVDAFGNLYIADSQNNRIRMVSTNGVITTMAGNGYINATNDEGGYSGDGGAATNASLNYPRSVAVDALGNLYIADSANGRVRVVNTNGIITTVAGGGNGGDGGASTNASLAPSGMAFDAFGNLYIADDGNSRIRMVNTNGIITTVAGNGTAAYGGDGGAATNASLDVPTVVAFDGFGNMYIGDTLNNRIRKVLPNSGFPRLTLGNIGTTNAGNYSVVITSPYGSVTSAVVTLTVLLPPTISTQPASQVAVVGSSPGFSVIATGTPPLNYSWYFNTTNLVQNGTNSLLTLPYAAVSNSGSYVVVITNSYGNVTSQVATLTVGFPPSVSAQSGSQTNVAGSTATFTATASGTGPFTYQWQLNGTNLLNGIISTLAGNGTTAYAGDGGVATNASLYYPSGVAFDAFGDLYTADQDHNRIREVTTSGIITTVAGNGTNKFAGDGGAATSASFSLPSGVTLDAYGNLYIADQNNNRIRKVATNGIITTVAGNGTAAYGGDGGAATNAKLNSPTGVVVDALGNIFIADKSNDRIRKVDTNGIITTIAGKTAASYSGDGGAATNASLYLPSGVTLDAYGNLYIADYDNSRVRMVNTNGIITTVAGKATAGYSGDGGAATNASLYLPSGVTLDAYGNLYIADYDNSRVRKVSTNGIITTVAGNGISGYNPNNLVATNTDLSYPAGVALDAAGNLYIADQHNERVRKVLLYASYPTLTLTQVGATNAGSYTVVISSPYGMVTNTPATLTVLYPPTISTQPANQFAANGGNASFSMAASGTPPFNYSWYFGITNLVQSGSSNTLALSSVTTNNAGNYTVVVTNNYGSVTSLIAVLSVGFPPAVVAAPVSQTNLVGSSVTFNVMASGTGPFTYQWQLNGTNFTNNIITTVAGNNSGGYSGDGGPATNASLLNPAGVAFDTSGNLYISDNNNERIRRVDANGIITTLAGTNGAGAYAGDGGPATNARLNFPTRVAFDPFGNLYIADQSNNRIRKVTTNGFISTIAGNGSATYAGDGGPATNASLSNPCGLTFDAYGNLYIADQGNNRIRKVALLNSIITTVAGNGTPTYAGDGGAAINASLNFPCGVSFDAAGNMYISDTDNSRIRKVSTSGIITTVASDSFPQGVAFDALGNLYIADTGANLIQKLVANNTLSTVAGGGRSGLGDGGPATKAGLQTPPSIAFDASGNLYIADYQDNRIREVHFAGFPTFTLTNASFTNAGNYSVVISSPYGSVTSALASLTVTIPTNAPQIIASDSSFGVTTNQTGNQSAFGFNLTGAVGQTIIIDASTDLVNWLPLFTNTANGSPVYFFDPSWTNFPGRYYRARLP